jgi:pyruvate kinase
MLIRAAGGAGYSDGVPRRTKIIATLGPASADPEIISQMVEAGMDVARLNFSHGSYDSHAELIVAVRAAAADHDRAVAVMQDIQGPRIRVGTFPGKAVEIEPGSEVRLTAGDGEGDASLVYVQHMGEVAIEVGTAVVMNDGLIQLEVTSVDGETAIARAAIARIASFPFLIALVLR